MKIRTHLALAFLTATCTLAAAATEAAAGPLPLEVLGPMRARTVKLIGDARDQAKLLEIQEQQAFETFANEAADPRSLQPGAYEKLLGAYFQKAAEIGANRAAQDAIIAALTSHLAEVDQQIQAWRTMGLSNEEINVRLKGFEPIRPLTINTPGPARFPAVD